MSRSPIVTLEDLERYVQTRPSRLGCWRGGQGQRQALLGWLIHKANAEVRHVAEETSIEFALALLASSNHNQVGLASGWITRYMVGKGSRSAVSEADRDALFATAGTHWALRNAIAEVRGGARSFSVSRGRVRLAYTSDNRVDALDRMFDLMERMRQATTAPRPSSRAGPWLRENRAADWQDLPPTVVEDFRRYSVDVLATMPRYLPERGSIAGVPTQVFDAFWVELLARGCLYNIRAMLGVEDPVLLAPRIHRHEFVESIARAIESDIAPVDRIVSLLSVDMERCSDPSLTPLVELEDDIVPMSTSIMLTSPHRNFLAILQRDPSLVGEAGRLMGLVGEEQTVQVLGRLKAGVLLSRRVKVTRSDGTQAGDIDVLACDPVTNVAVALEVRWGLTADGNEEVHRVEAAAIDKRAQVVRLRGEVQRGAHVNAPADWPDLTNFDWRWFLLTRDVLPMKEIATDGIVIRSVQLLQYMLKPESELTTLCALLDDPPWPPIELQETHWDSVRYGDVRVDVELINA